MTVMNHSSTNASEDLANAAGEAFGTPGPPPVSAREVVDEMVDAGPLDDVMAMVATGELALTGAGGFLPEMPKAALERGLAVELDDHLGYVHGDPGGHGSGNSRNGTSPTTVAATVGDVPLDVPRERAA